MTNYDIVGILRRRFRIKKTFAKEFLAEFLGTFILIVFGNGSVAQKVLGGNGVNDFYSVIWGYSLGVLLGVIVAGGVSGAHINPAVTLAMAIWGKLPWNKVPIYMVAQYLGAFVASVVLFYEYSDALVAFESNKSVATAGIWATYPGMIVDASGVQKEFITSMNGFGDQVLGTALLLIAICAISDKRNLDIPKYLSPLFVAFTVMNIGLSFGFSTGFAINPARDLSPRFFTLLAGWNDIPFSTSTVDEIAWWWVPIIGPHLGAIIGVLVYTVFIEMHHDDDDEEEFLPLKGTKINSSGVFVVSPATNLEAMQLSGEKISSIKENGKKPNY